MERRRERAKQQEQKFNEDFFHSEYEYQSHQPAPFQRTSVELTFDEKDRKLSEHEKGLKTLEYSRNRERLRAEETFGS